MEIELTDVGYVYQNGTPMASRALQDVNLVIPEGEFLAIVGHTGSGKSTLLQHLNGLLVPTEGSVAIGERIILPDVKPKNLRDLRKRVGIVFQFPEQQLFEETVLKDICFGPLNFGASKEEATQLAERMIELVGLDQSFLSVSPFDLSGGQMRRVAIAGVLAMEPEVLVLDEPTAGLDPLGARDMMRMFRQIQREQQQTMVLVTHNMEDAATYADRIAIMQQGTIVGLGTPEEIFGQPQKLFEMGLTVPNVVRFQMKVEEQLGKRLSRLHLSIETLAQEISQIVR